MAQEVELLGCLMDGSGSMNGQKSIIQRNAVENLFKRLSNSSASGVFRASLTYFSGNASVEKNKDGGYYFGVGTASEQIKNACDVAGGGNTAAHIALEKQFDVLDQFVNDEELPDEKKVTFIIFTDGMFDDPSKALHLIGELQSRYPGLNPTIATIAVGPDADKRYLAEIASSANSRQITHLDRTGVLTYLPDPRKLFLCAHEVDGTITNERIEAIRMFLNVLTGTVAEVSN